MIDDSFSRLKTAIKSTARPASLGDDCFSMHDELLICRLPCDVAGFVLLNGQPDEHFDRAYRAFKVLYREHKPEWDHLSLSFVLLSDS